MNLLIKRLARSPYADSRFTRRFPSVPQHCTAADCDFKPFHVLPIFLGEYRYSGEVAGRYPVVYRIIQLQHSHHTGPRRAVRGAPERTAQEIRLSRIAPNALRRLGPTPNTSAVIVRLRAAQGLHGLPADAGRFACLVACSLGL